MIPYLKEALLGFCGLLIVVIGVQTARLNLAKSQLEARNETVTALTQQLQNAGQQVLALRAEIEETNEQIREKELLAARAQAAQEQVDELAERLAKAEAELTAAVIAHNKLRVRVKDLTTCETYEVVLRTIAGEEQ